MPQERNSSTAERMKDSKRRRENAQALLRASEQKPSPKPAGQKRGQDPNAHAEKASAYKSKAAPKHEKEPLALPKRSVKAGGHRKQKAEKPPVRIKRSALITIIALVCAAGAFIGLYFLTIVDNITVTGCETYSEQKVLDLSGLYTGKNMFLYDLSAAKKRIESDPYLKCTGISRSLPSTLTIGIEERREFAAVHTSSGTACIIDKEGYVLRVGASSGTEGLIPIYGLASAGNTVGITIDEDKSLLRPYTIMEMIRAIGDRTWVIGSIDVTNTSSVKLVTPDGLTVMLGDSIDIPQKIERMFRVLDKIDKEKLEGSVLYINSNGTADISPATPAPTADPDSTQEPLPTNVPEDTDSPEETDLPADTEEPGETAGPGSDN